MNNLKGPFLYYMASVSPPNGGFVDYAVFTKGSRKTKKAIEKLAKEALKKALELEVKNGPWHFMVEKHGFKFALDAMKDNVEHLVLVAHEIGHNGEVLNKDGDVILAAKNKRILVFVK